MNIKDFTYSTANENKTLYFDRINYLSFKELLLLASTISVYYNILGAEKENKDISKNIPEDSQCNINIELGGELFYWIRKYNSSRNTFSVLQFSQIKNFANKQSNNRMNNLENRYLPFYYLQKSKIEYSDGDYFDKAYFRSMESVYSNPIKFLHEFVTFDFISKQDKDKNLFAERFNDFLNHFSINNIKCKEVHYDYIDELSNVSYLGKSHLHLRFYLIDDNDNKIYFSDMLEEEVSFILLLGEIFYRLYMIRLFTHHSELTIYDIKGIFISYNHIKDEYIFQLQKKLPNIQIFLKSN